MHEIGRLKRVIRALPRQVPRRNRPQVVIN